MLIGYNKARKRGLAGKIFLGWLTIVNPLRIRVLRPEEGSEAGDNGSSSGYNNRGNG